MDNVKRISEIAWNIIGCDLTDVKPESRLIADLGADDLDCIEIMMDIETEFDIDIPDADWEEIQEKTIADIAKYVDERLQQR